MCHSQAEGGQRCHGHARTALATAENRYQPLARQAQTAQETGTPIPAELRAKGLQASYDLDDARARYASTPQGETDLAARMDALTIHGHAPSPHGIPGTQYRAYAEAISEGRRLRARATEIRNSVTTGAMTGKTAEACAAFPNTRALAYRNEQIAKARNGGPQLLATATKTVRRERAAANGNTNTGPLLPSHDSAPCPLCGTRPVAWIQQQRTPTGQTHYTKKCNDC